MTEEITLQEAENLGKIFFRSGLFSDAKSEAQAIVKILAGRELGIPPLISMTKVHIIQGKIAIGADLMAQKIKESKEYDYRVVEHTEKRCVIDFFQKRENGWKKIGNSVFTIEDAEKAGLLKPKIKDGVDYNLWGKYPRNLLFARAISNGARWFCPHLISGAYTPEELGAEEIVNGKVEEQKGEVKELPKSKYPEQIEKLFGSLGYGEAEKEEIYKKYVEVYGEEKGEEKLQERLNMDLDKKVGNGEKEEKTKKKKVDKKIIRIKELQNKLGILDEEYRVLLQKNFGVNSSKDLTEEQKDNFIKELAEQLNLKLKSEKEEKQ